MMLTCHASDFEEQILPEFLAQLMGYICKYLQFSILKQYRVARQSEVTQE